MGIKIEGATRGDVFGVEYEKIVFPEPGDALYDGRVMRPITDEFVENIARFGYEQNAGAKQVGDDKVKLIWGRRRARALPLANALREKMGWGKPLRLPVTIKNGTDEELFIYTIIENENREADGILAKAQKAKRLVDYGHKPEDIRRAFGVSRLATIEGWMKVLDLDKATLEALAEGRLSDSAAIKLCQLTAEERTATIAEAKALGKAVSTSRAREAVSKKKGVGRASAARRKLCQEAVNFARNPGFAWPLKKAAVAYAKTQKGAKKSAKK